MVEGIAPRQLNDIHGGSPAFDEAYGFFMTTLNGDSDAREKCGLKDLNPFKEDPEGFIKAVEEAKNYIARRQNTRQTRKASNRKGVNIVYEDERCLITATDDVRKSKEAGNLCKINGRTRCPWCISLKYPANAHHWARYHT